MGKDYIELLLNPVRQRIAQALISKGRATTGELLEYLNDIPRASLYRHIKVLDDAGIIYVVKEEVKRGALEKTYALSQPDLSNATNESMNQMVQNTFMQLSFRFSDYFSKEGINPEKDMVTVGGATILMTDEEYAHFLQDYAKLLENALKNKPKEGRKARQVTFLSLPK